MCSRKMSTMSSDAILLMQVWPGGPFEQMVEMQRQRNMDYCKAHNFDLEILVGTLSPKYADFNVGSWVKVEQMIAALKKGYKYIVSLEPDTLIKDTSADLREGCPRGVGACYHRHPVGHQWNVGALYMQNSPEAMAFMEEWLAEWPAEPLWRDNGAFNVVAMRNHTAQTISDRWNATLDCSMVPDAVVLGFHGVGINANARLETMKKVLAQI